MGSEPIPTKAPGHLDVHRGDPRILDDVSESIANDLRICEKDRNGHLLCRTTVSGVGWMKLRFNFSCFPSKSERARADVKGEWHGHVHEIPKQAESCAYMQYQHISTITVPPES